MSFAADTALEPLGPGRWRAQVHERWWVVKGPFGGTIAALLARALGEVTRWPPRTLAVHFVDAPTAGPVDLTAQVLREGRSTQSVSLALHQDGRPMALALAGAGARRPDEVGWDEVAMPQAAPPEDCPRVPAEGGVPFLGELDVRWVDGSRPGGPPGGRAANLAWLRPAGDAPPAVDDVLLAALADVWLPPAFGRLGGLAIVPTLDLTIHFRAPVPPGTGWVLAHHHSEDAANGTWVCDGELWAPDGTLLVRARQLAMLRT